MLECLAEHMIQMAFLYYFIIITDIIMYGNEMNRC